MLAAAALGGGLAGSGAGTLPSLQCAWLPSAPCNLVPHRILHLQDSGLAAMAGPAADDGQAAQVPPAAAGGEGEQPPAPGGGGGDPQPPQEQQQGGEEAAEVVDEAAAAAAEEERRREEERVQAEEAGVMAEAARIRAVLSAFKVRGGSPPRQPCRLRSQAVGSSRHPAARP